jgi:hypothetical protein
MTEVKADNRIATLERALADATRELEGLRRQVNQQGIEASDAAGDGGRPDLQHGREMTTERDRTAAAEYRADLAELKQSNLQTAYDIVVRNAQFNRLVLDWTIDCIKILDLEGRIEFMNTGGQRVMEVDDFSSQVAGCPWPEFWQGDDHVKASEAVEAAKAGRTAQFEGPADTARQDHIAARDGQ